MKSEKSQNKALISFRTIYETTRFITDDLGAADGAHILEKQTRVVTKLDLDRGQKICRFYSLSK
jgi:hypothetical protein